MTTALAFDLFLDEQLLDGTTTTYDITMLSVVVDDNSENDFNFDKAENENRENESLKDKEKNTILKLKDQNDNSEIKMLKLKDLIIDFDNRENENINVKLNKIKNVFSENDISKLMIKSYMKLLSN